MWVLESRGDFFQGRRMWLKPGKQYLFGRVKKDGVRFALDNKTVSRKHFIIEVDNVQESDIGKTHARTVVTITDQGSKTGTLVNGEKAKEPRILTRSENVIKLGACPEELIVKWEPVVLTFNLLKKEIKSGLLKSKQLRVRDLDIKAISDFIPGTSSLLVVGKRNTAKGLQALIDGKPLVDESYIDALEYAATPTELDEEENLSPLELDYDGAWPKPAEHLPPQSKEPTTRPPESYAPDPNRANIFEDYTFVFGDQTQYDNLLPPITSGHGKAILFSVVDGETTSDELITFMRAAAGRKSFGDNHKDMDNGAVIMVRWTSKSHGEWTNDLINEIALGLNQRAIEQGEFLDAILANNALSLRQALPSESSRKSQPIPPPVSATAAVSNNRSSEEDDQAISIPAARQVHGSETSVTRRSADSGPSLGGTVHSFDDATTRVKEPDSSPPPAKVFRFSPPRKTQSAKFDDDFDENAIIPYGEDDDNMSHGNSYHERSSSPAAPHQISPEDSHGNKSVEHQPLRSNKRQRSGTQEELDLQEGGDGLDAMLPGISSLKRRKFAQNVAAEQQLQAKLKRGGVVLPLPKSRSMKEVNVKEELKAKREADRQRAQEAGDNEDEQPLEYDENGNLPVYEVITDYMDLPVRKEAAPVQTDIVNDRWDPRWNGRKNFKAFRRARDQADENAFSRRRLHTRLIVPLVDAKQATYGIGDQYWERTEEDKERDKERKRRASQRTTQSQNNSSSQQGTNGPSPEENTHGTAREATEADDNGSINEISVGNAQLTKNGVGLDDDAIGVLEPGSMRPVGSTSTQMATASSSPKGPREGLKRLASTRHNAVDKRQKTLSATNSHRDGSDSDDSDDMKFKFGRGRRGRGRGRA